MTLKSSVHRRLRTSESREAVSYNRLNRDIIQTDENDELFPRHAPIEEVSEIDKDMEYPVNWRRLP